MEASVLCFLEPGYDNATPLQELHSIGILAKRNNAHSLIHLNVVVAVKQVEVTHLERDFRVLLERLNVVMVRASNNNVIDVDHKHQLRIIVPPDVDGMFQLSPMKV
jgi:hypothetical protein